MATINRGRVACDIRRAGDQVTSKSMSLLFHGIVGDSLEAQ